MSTPNHKINGRDINADQTNSYNDEVLEINGEEMRRNAPTFTNIFNHFLKRFMTDCMLASFASTTKNQTTLVSLR